MKDQGTDSLTHSLFLSLSHHILWKDKATQQEIQSNLHLINIKWQSKLSMT